MLQYYSLDCWKWSNLNLTHDTPHTNKYISSSFKIIWNMTTSKYVNLHLNQLIIDCLLNRRKIAKTISYSTQDDKKQKHILCEENWDARTDEFCGKHNNKSAGIFEGEGIFKSNQSTVGIHALNTACCCHNHNKRRKSARVTPL